MVTSEARRDALRPLNDTDFKFLALFVTYV